MAALTKVKCSLKRPSLAFWVYYVHGGQLPWGQLVKRLRLCPMSGAGGLVSKELQLQDERTLTRPPHDERDVADYGP